MFPYMHWIKGVRFQNINRLVLLSKVDISWFYKSSNKQNIF